MKKMLPIVLILLVLALGTVLYWKYGQKQMGATGVTPPGEMIACTMDAKICPDGSSVGRSGPNCEFAACPGEAGNANGGAAGIQLEGSGTMEGAAGGQMGEPIKFPTGGAPGQ